MKSISTFYKALCCTAFLLFSAMGMQAQNDACTGAIPLACGATVSGSTVGATTDNVGTCVTANTAPGVWYQVVGTGASITLSTCNAASYDTKISVFSGSCGSLTCVTGNDDASGCGTTSELSFQSMPGQVYLVLVHGFGSGTGTFSLTATCASAPTGNDVCSGATPVACGSSVSGTTVGTSPDNAPVCGTTNTAPGVWHQVVGTGNAITASLCTGTSFDTKLGVFSGSCAALSCIDGNDDFCGLQSEVTFNSVPGQVYYILVHGFGSASGAYTLSITCPAPLANDDACNATPVTFGATPFSNVTATAQTGEPNPGSGTGPSSCNSQDGWCSFELDIDNSVWFTFQAPASGCISAVADGFDSQITLYDVTDCNDFTTYVEVAANDDSGDDVVPTATSSSGGLIETSCLVPGRTYYIQVDGYNGASSATGSLILIDCGGSLVSVDAGDCQSRYIGYAPAEADTNFLVANASGVGPFTFVWSAVGDQDIIFQDGMDSSSVIAVQPDSSTVYTVTVTDGRNCTTTATVEVTVINVGCGNNGVSICCTPQSSGILLCDFDTDGNGNFLPGGRVITNQYANRGVRISANNFGNGPNDAVIFNSSSPTGGDYDLGTPNADFGGPGIGNGGRLGQPGANNVPLGKLLIVQENANPKNCGPNNDDYCNPDDEADGGALIFDFDCPTTIQDVTIVDADDGNPSGAVLTFNGGASFAMIPNLGNNSTQTVYVNQPGVTHMEVVFAGSGGLASFHYKPDTTNICVEQGTIDIDSMLALPVYSLGPCGNPCTATNPSIAPPPACVDLIVNVTTDDFASETSFEVVDLGTGLTIGTRQFTFSDDLTAFSDTFCVDPRRCYAVTIFDSFGDGICCNFGNGAFSVEFDSTVINSPSGGAFASSETIQVGNCTPNKEEGSSAESVVADMEEAVSVMAYPNPTNGETTIKFLSPKTGPVQVELFTMQGVRVAMLYSGVIDANVPQFIEFDTQAMPAGIYLYRMTSETSVKAGKLQVVH